MGCGPRSKADSSVCPTASGRPGLSSGGPPLPRELCPRQPTSLPRRLPLRPSPWPSPLVGLSRTAATSASSKAFVPGVLPHCVSPVNVQLMYNLCTCKHKSGAPMPDCCASPGPFQPAGSLDPSVGVQYRAVPIGA